MSWGVKIAGSASAVAAAAEATNMPPGLKQCVRELALQSPSRGMILSTSGHIEGGYGYVGEFQCHLVDLYIDPQPGTPPASPPAQ